MTRSGNPIGVPHYASYDMIDCMACGERRAPRVHDPICDECMAEEKIRHASAAYLKDMDDPFRPWVYIPNEDFSGYIFVDGLRCKYPSDL